VKRPQATTILLLLAAALLLPASAMGQATQTFRVQFNFSNPGARSLALGGAFIGLADDATAAYTNPAGLTNLSRPEVSAEGRRWGYTEIYPSRGHAFGQLVQGFPGSFDDTEGIVNGQSKDSVNGLAFLSYVYPHKNWSLGFYRQELANFEANVQTDGPFFNANVGTMPVIFRFFPTQARADLKIVNYGLSGAYRLNDRFSIGLGLSEYDFSLNVRTQAFGFVNNPGPTVPGGILGVPNFSPANLLFTDRQKGTGTALSGSLGLLFKVTPNWSLGAVYRQKARFDTTETISTSSTVMKSKFTVPEVYGFGTAFKPTDQLTVTADLNRIRYSQTSRPAPNVRADDGDEFHYGLEYVLLKLKYPLSFRLGAWHDPDHQPSYRGLPDDTFAQRGFAVLFPAGQDYWHYSGGLGFVFGERFQVDAAVDISKLVDTFSLSSVFRF